MTIVLFVIGIILKNELFETFSSSLLFEGQKSLTLKKKNPDLVITGNVKG